MADEMNLPENMPEELKKMLRELNKASGGKMKLMSPHEMLDFLNSADPSEFKDDEAEDYVIDSPNKVLNELIEHASTILKSALHLGKYGLKEGHPSKAQLSDVAEAAFKTVALSAALAGKKRIDIKCEIDDSVVELHVELDDKRNSDIPQDTDELDARWN